MKSQKFDKKEKSILELDKLFKDFGKNVAMENSAVSQQIEALTNPSRETRDSINQSLAKHNRAILDLMKQNTDNLTQLNTEISKLIEKTKICFPQLDNFLKYTSQ